LVSANDTGTSAVDADTDGDGFEDGTEIDEGSNPNDPLSTPDAPEVPLLPGALAALLALSLAFAPRALRRAHRRSPC
ncbi:MAG TPA: thrombospondin type 3 repeat-containing protein, partial [Myxococcota bacterium]|nr:thrombospondin type 3 repeat-containing protein [Myxococcota bacterium]